MPRFRDIPQFPHCNYRATVPWTYLEEHIQSCMEKYPDMAQLDLNPDFQRGHVWTPDQQSAYVEYILRGGQAARDLYFNCTGWNKAYEGPYVIVDGKQRLEAARAFMRNEVPAFGYLYNQYEDKLSWADVNFTWNVAALPTRADVLKWYLDFNGSGTPHAQSELERVRALLSMETS